MTCFSDDTSIKCTTNMAREDHANDAFFVTIEHIATSNIHIKAKQLFTYKPDPEISNIYPLVSIVE